MDPRDRAEIEAFVSASDDAIVELEIALTNLKKCLAYEGLPDPIVWRAFARLCHAYYTVSDVVPMERIANVSSDEFLPAFERQVLLRALRKRKQSSPDDHPSLTPELAAEVKAGREGASETTLDKVDRLEKVMQGWVTKRADDRTH